MTHAHPDVQNLRIEKCKYCLIRILITSMRFAHRYKEYSFKKLFIPRNLKIERPRLTPQANSPINSFK
jgi:hypothetical protein